MFEAAFKNIDDTLWKDAGCSSELNYIEQTSWVLFLKYLDDYEADKAMSAKLDGETSNILIPTSLIMSLKYFLKTLFAFKTYRRSTNWSSLHYLRDDRINTFINAYTSPMSH